MWNRIYKTLALALMIMLTPPAASVAKESGRRYSTVAIWKGSDAGRRVENSRARMFVFLPSPEKANGAGVIVCPGGSYHHLGIEGEGYEVARRLNEDGFAAFVLRYRTGMYGYRYPAMIQDLQRAMQLVRERGDEYGVRPDAVGVMGFSAGGHLAGTLAEYGGDNFMEPLGIAPQVALNPAFAVMLYPVVSMVSPVTHEKSRRNLLGGKPDAELARKMSLELNVHPDVPPVLVFQAKDDPVVDYRNAELLGNALSESAANFEIVMRDTGGHGFGVKPAPDSGMAGWYDTFTEWYYRNFAQ